jgi:hypothetical protein
MPNLAVVGKVYSIVEMCTHYIHPMIKSLVNVITLLLCVACSKFTFVFYKGHTRSLMHLVHKLPWLHVCPCINFSICHDLDP